MIASIPQLQSGFVTKAIKGSETGQSVIRACGKSSLLYFLYHSIAVVFMCEWRKI